METYSRLHTSYYLSIPTFGSFFPWITSIWITPRGLKNVGTCPHPG